MNFLRFICEASYDAMIASMKQKYPDHSQVIDWAKPNLNKQDRVVWYLNTVRSYLESNNVNSIEALQQNLIHYLGQPIPQIQNFVFAKQPAQEIFNQFAALEQRWRDKQDQSKPPVIQQGDQKIIEFADGSAWWRLNRAYCPDEGRSGRHCGNLAGKRNTDQRTLSYRSKDGHVILTFILEPDGKLGEMKAVANQKPDAKYHPAIIQLLLNPAIKGITGGGYSPINNFSIFDLDEKNQLFIWKHKPNLIVDQVVADPINLLRTAPEIQSQPDLQEIALKKYPGMKFLFEKNDIKSWQQALNQNPELILFAPPELPDYKELMHEYIAFTNPDDFDRIPEQLKKDFNFLEKLIIESDGSSQIFEYINPNIQGYYELCKIAVDKYSDAFAYVDENFITPELAYMAVVMDGNLLEYVPEKLRTPELCLLAIKTSTDVFYSDLIPKKVLTPEFYLEAVKINGLNLQNIPEHLRTPEICLAAVKRDEEAIRAVPEKLQTPEICLIAVKQNGIVLGNIRENRRTHEICLAAVKENGWALRYVPENLRTLEICFEAVRQIRIIGNRTNMLQYVPDKLKQKVQELLDTGYDHRPGSQQYESIDRLKNLAGIL
jgi:hypothetical protein